jgi:hypothetical protein
MREFNIVAALAELWHSLVKKHGMVAAMDLMADETALLNRRMGPDLRPSFFCVALVAELIYCIGLYHFITAKGIVCAVAGHGQGTECPHGIMAVCAFHSALSNRMV